MVYDVVSPGEDASFIVHFTAPTLEAALAWCEKHQTAANWVVMGRRV
jgi:hypothetical protein